jgi:hypothetical protein
MHLRTLDQLELDGDVLIFMDEQQASGLWGCRLTDAADDNPPALVAGDPTDPSWEEEGISTLALLKLFHLVNRPYEPPCLQVDGCPTLSGPELLRLGWDEYVFPLRVGPSSFWVKGSAVSDEVAIGARSRAELEQALQDIGADRWTSDILVR